MIPFEARLRDDWAGWPNQDSTVFAFRTRTTRYLDGQPYDKPFEYPSPFATVGWFHLDKLSEGRHTIHAVLEYEITQQGQKRKGEIRSKESTFEILPANTPDDLLAPKSDATTKAVRGALTFEGVRTDQSPFSADIDRLLPTSRYPPQVTWELS